MSIHLDGIRLRRGRRTVLERIDADLPAGCRIALCGPNGAGKSSLLEIIAGDLKPDGGRVTVNGHRPRALSPAERARMRAVLVQQTELAHPFRVEQVVELGPYTAGEPDRATLLEELGIAALPGRRYTELSGGEQRLVQLARVLRQLDDAPDRPAWLLLDEPVSHLDLGMTRRVLAAAGRRAEAGQGVLAVLHDLELASRWADRILVLSAGRIVADGAPRQALAADVVSPAWGLDLDVLPEEGGGVRIRSRDAGI